MKNLYAFLLVFFALSFTIRSQEDSSFVESRQTVLGINFDFGLFLEYSDFPKELEDSYPVAVSLDLSKHLVTSKSWDFCNCFPSVGVNLAYWNWGNSDILGSGISALAFLEPNLRTHKRTSFFFRTGIGGVYLTNPYDEETNPLNLSYSTYWGYYLMIGIGVNYRIDEKLNLRLTTKYNHFSNGGGPAPNKGLDIPSLSVGLNRSLEPIAYPNPEDIDRELNPDEKKRISLVHFSGWSNTDVGDSDKYYVFGFAFNYSRWIGGNSALNLGTEWIVDLSRREQLELMGSNDSFQQGGILAGHEFWLGRITFSQKLGVYYFKEYRNTPDLYQRYGLTYNFTKNIFAGMNLKTHGLDIDFFDFRLGYTF